jgi:hypothetical protein
MPAGRPTIFTDSALHKLEEAFAIGASDTEACFYADVGTSALYNYQKEHPEFVERKNALKERPVLLARQTVVKAIETDSDLAFKYLERKRKHEFASRTEITGADGDTLIPEFTSDQAEQLLQLRAKRANGSE